MQQKLRKCSEHEPELANSLLQPDVRLCTFIDNFQTDYFTQSTEVSFSVSETDFLSTSIATEILTESTHRLFKKLDTEADFTTMTTEKYETPTTPAPICSRFMIEAILRVNVDKYHESDEFKEIVNVMRVDCFKEYYTLKKIVKESYQQCQKDLKRGDTGEA